MNNWIHFAIWAAAIVVVFGILWWQGQITRLAGYCRETWVELQKCAWPSAEELKGQTALIIIMVVLLGVYIYVLDMVLSHTIFPK